MKQASWQAGQVHAFEAFGGVPRMLIPDNAATAVNRGVRWVTCVNEEYERFAEHYQTAVLPTRVRRPRDKSVAESVVDLVERWIIAPANEHRFYSISEFNEFCADKVAWLNTRPFTAKEGSRQSVFEAEEQDQLLALPDTPYEMCRWRSAKVGPDYHVRIDHMRYSVPHTLIGTQVDIKESTTTITIMANGQPVAQHHRLYGRKGQYSTIVEHMPANHAGLDNPWSADRFINWANNIGPETAAAITTVLASRPIVEQSFVACRNILGLSKTYTPQLLEAAAHAANASTRTPSYTSLKKTQSLHSKQPTQQAKHPPKHSASPLKTSSTEPKTPDASEEPQPTNAKEASHADRRTL